MSLERLRDEFAMAAMNGLVARSTPIPLNPGDYKSFAFDAYLMADAMLTERKARCPACGQFIDPDKGFVVHASGCTWGWPEESTAGEL